jgi:hypothetical protein
MSWRRELEDRYSVKCKGCSHEHLDPNKQPNQRYSKEKCPECGYDPANPDPFIQFGAIARNMLLMQAQHASKYLTGDYVDQGYPDFSEGIRIKGSRADYHSLLIHKDDVRKFVLKVCRHMSREPLAIDKTIDKLRGKKAT